MIALKDVQSFSASLPARAESPLQGYQEADPVKPLLELRVPVEATKFILTYICEIGCVNMSRKENVKIFSPLEVAVLFQRTL